MDSRPDRVLGATIGPSTLPSSPRSRSGRGRQGHDSGAISPRKRSVPVNRGTRPAHPTPPRGTDRKEVRTVVLAIVLIVLAILLGLGGLLFTALKWLLIVAAVLLVAGIVMGVIGRGKARSVR